MTVVALQTCELHRCPRGGAKVLSLHTGAGLPLLPPKLADSKPSSLSPGAGTPCRSLCSPGSLAAPSTWVMDGVGVFPSLPLTSSGVFLLLEPPQTCDWGFHPVTEAERTPPVVCGFPVSLPDNADPSPLLLLFCCPPEDTGAHHNKT